MKKKSKAPDDALKPNARAAVRIMPDEMPAFEKALQATGQKNISKAIKTAVFAYPQNKELASELKAMRGDLQKLTDTINAQGALIVALRGRDD